MDVRRVNMEVRLVGFHPLSNFHVIKHSITLTNLLSDWSFFAKVVEYLGSSLGYLGGVLAPI
jgi:hypothetical protein